MTVHHLYSQLIPLPAFQRIAVLRFLEETRIPPPEGYMHQNVLAAEEALNILQQEIDDECESAEGTP
jgi:hypothetical protein